MATFAEQMTTDSLIFMEPSEFGAVATYRDQDFNNSQCSVLIEHDVLLQPSGFDSQVVELGTTIEALFSEVGEPKKDDVFTIDSTAYIVMRITENDKVFVKMIVSEEPE